MLSSVNAIMSKTSAKKDEDYQQLDMTFLCFIYLSLLDAIVVRVKQTKIIEYTVYINMNWHIVILKYIKKNCNNEHWYQIIFIYTSHYVFIKFYFTSWF